MSKHLIRELLNEFLNDLPVMITAGLIYWFVRRIIHKKRFGEDFKEVRQKSRLNEIIGLLLVMWAALIVCSTLLPRWGDRHYFTRIGFPQWGVIPDIFNGDFDLSHSMLNMLMFAPVGLALPFVLKRSGFGRTVLAGFCFTFSIEFLQGFSSMRDGNVDDVICNTAGTAVGYLLYLLMKLLFPKFTKKCMIKAEK